MSMPSNYDSSTFSADGDPGREKKGSGCLKGCLIAVIVVVLLAIVAAVVVYFNGRRWATNFVATGINHAIDASELPDQEKQEVKAQIDRVAQEFGSGRMTGEQMGRILENLAKSPVMTAIIASVVDQKYLSKSGLSDEEKAAGRQEVRRFVRGIVDGKIPDASTDAVMEKIATRGPNQEWVLRESVSDEELRAFLAAAKAEADKAEIPAEPGEFDPSDEIKKLIDDATAEPVAM
jgi:hypothetical protein